MLRMGALQREGSTLGQGADVGIPDPGREVIGELMGLLVGPRDDDEGRCWRQSSAANREVCGTRDRGHAKDAQFRQMGPEDTDERSNAAITAA